MGGVLPIVQAVAPVVGILSGMVQGNQQKNAAKDAASQAVANANATKAQADQAFNAANKKKPNVQGLQSENQQSAAAGPASTMLTGPQGVDPTSLLLNKTTLLGS